MQKPHKVLLPDLWLLSCNKKFENSSIVIEAIGTVFILFFYERYFKCKKQKQKHLSNIQPNISTSKKHLSNIQPNIFKQKKHLSNIIQTIYTKNTSRYVLKHLKKASMKHLEQKLLVTS